MHELCRCISGALWERNACVVSAVWSHINKEKPGGLAERGKWVKEWAWWQAAGLKIRRWCFFKREMFLLLQIKGSLVAPVSSQCWMNNFNFHVLLFFSYYRLGSGTLLSSLWLRLRGNLTLPSTGVAPSPMCSPGCPMVVRESLSCCPETPRTTKMLPLRGSAESWRR